MKRITLVVLLCAGAALACKRDKGSAANANPTAPPIDAYVLPNEPRGNTALPGAEPFRISVQSSLAKALAAAPADYVPRTKHKRADGTPLYSNRLLLESSPYLRQHAHNPVNWYPWGDEAFAEAQRRKVPVLLSIGYSTCHWCHVMEEESFEDVEIATYLNANYVAIKVDREERPDLDAIYMTAVQMITGSGGWPMTVWLTPDRQPFYGGTYFPPRTGARGQRTGFLEWLQRLKKAYTEDGVRVIDGAKELARRIEEHGRAGGGGTSVDGPGYLHRAALLYQQRQDTEWGGLRTRKNKFPSSFPVRLLFRYWRRTGQTHYRDMATFALEKMAAGGMYDHIGGGFHRYSVDHKWLVPHFEKMLYDNALLTVMYLDGHQATGRASFANVARDILRYVRREMTAPAGGFYSATDADSLDAKGHRVEGAFFTWKPHEIRAALSGHGEIGGKSVADIVIAYYDVTAKGNFVHEGVSRSVLWTPKPAARVAKSLGITTAQLRAAVARARAPLYAARAKRPAPIRDDKILAAWNGKMISAFARAHIVLGVNTDGGPSYAAQAARAAEHVLTKMRRGGRLLRAYKNGRAYLPGYLPDYAFMIQGLIDLFEATSERRWLDEAIALDEVVAARFEDTKKGGFFFVADDHEKLLARQKPAYDGARPSGNSIMAMNLLRLSELTGNYKYRERADTTFAAFADNLGRAATNLAYMLLAIDFATDTAKQIVLVAPKDRSEAEPFLRALSTAFVPNQVLAVVAQGAQLERVAQSVPIVKDKVANQGVTAYVCEQQRCELPTRDPKVMLQQLSKITPLPK